MKWVKKIFKIPIFMSVLTSHIKRSWNCANNVSMDL